MPICDWCADFLVNKRLDRRPEDSLFKIDCPTNKPGIVEVAWFCNIEDCHRHIQSMYFTVTPIKVHQEDAESDCDQ